MPLTCQNAQLQVGAHGPVVDWLVKMRRLPSERMLDAELRSGSVDAGDVERVALLLADFYGRQVPVRFTEQDYLARIRKLVDENRRELVADLGSSGQMVEALHACRLRLFRESCPSLRVAHKRYIVEGHGDLRPEHVFLGSPPCIIDALEFSSDLRMLDPVQELAYLDVECAHVGNLWVGRRFVRSSSDARGMCFPWSCFSSIAA